MPEGDSLHRAAARLQPLVGQRLEVETPHPRAAAKRIAERLDGLRLESVEAVGKNLLLRFEQGLTLRSHLRMTGRWRLEPRGAKRVGTPWLVLRGAREEGVLWNGPVLELGGEAVRTLGPDVLAEEPDVAGMLRRLRAADQRREIGDALLDQTLLAGIGNIWKAEALWHARVSPWAPLGDLDDGALARVLDEVVGLMRASAAGRRPRLEAYRRRVCRRCGGRVAVRGQGARHRSTWWCPTCQAGDPGPAA